MEGLNAILTQLVKQKERLSHHGVAGLGRSGHRRYFRHCWIASCYNHRDQSAVLYRLLSWLERIYHYPQHFFHQSYPTSSYLKNAAWLRIEACKMQAFIHRHQLFFCSMVSYYQLSVHKHRSMIVPIIKQLWTTATINHDLLLQNIKNHEALPSIS